MTNENAVKGMSIKKKALIVLCALVSVVVIVATSVLATVAYLTSSAAVSNVFTIGKVGITMTETKVDSEGKKLSSGEQVDTNTYHLVPNKTYDKDPTIHVNEGSEKSFLFITLKNDIAAIADPNQDNIATQLKNNGWARFVDVQAGHVYVYVGTDKIQALNNGILPVGAASTDVTFATQGDYQLFSKFSIASDAVVDSYGAAKITINAFAIQDSGLDTVAKAWDAVVQTYGSYLNLQKTDQAQLPTIDD